MNDLTERLLTEYKPRLAIIAYTPDTNSWSDTYMESHIINDKGQVLAGKPLNQSTLEGIVDVFYEDQQKNARVGGLIPECLLHYKQLTSTEYAMIWYKPACVKNLHFKEGLNIPLGQAWVPPMVWRVNGKELSVFALTTNDRPTETTKIYRAPFHNVDTSGRVCLGSARVKKPVQITYFNLIAYWEDMFWGSEFTHLSGPSPVKGNINIIWKKLIEDNNQNWEQFYDKFIEPKSLSKIL